MPDPTLEGGYAADVDLTTGPTAEQLAAVVQLAQLQLDLDARIAEATAGLEALTAERRDVAERQLPDALTEAGLRSFALVDGSTVGVEEKIFGSVNKANAPAFHAWLIEHGHGDLIKRALTADCGRGDEALLEKLRTFITGTLGGSVKVTEKEGVHPQTLGAFVREQLARGVELPDSVSVVTVREAVIRKPKEKGAL